MPCAQVPAGFRTLNLDYPSRRHALEGLVEHVHGSASDFIGQDNAPVHFVTHSMGGLVARAYVARHRPKSLGRVVMLGPPNQGSEVADLLAGTVLYRKFFGPAGGKLTTFGKNALHQTLGNVDYSLGGIAGDRSVYLFASLIIQGPNDGRVSVARTSVAGMSDHLTLHVTHPLMARDPAVIRQAVHFLLHGRFIASSVIMPAAK